MRNRLVSKLAFVETSKNIATMASAQPAEDIGNWFAGIGRTSAQSNSRLKASSTAVLRNPRIESEAKE
jgi:hypothetical protein